MIGEYPALSEEDIRAILEQVRKASLDRQLSGLVIAAEHRSEPIR
jgi:hypothetical protein